MDSSAYRRRDPSSAMPPAERELARACQALFDNALGGPVALIGGKAVTLRLEEAGFPTLARRSADLDFMPIGRTDVDGRAAAQALTKHLRGTTVRSAGDGSCIAVVPWDGGPIKVGVQWAREHHGTADASPLDGMRVLTSDALLLTKLATFQQRLERKDLGDVACLLRAGANFDWAMNEIGIRSESTALDVVQAICQEHHLAVGPSTWSLPDGTSWESVTSDVAARLPRLPPNRAP